MNYRSLLGIVVVMFILVSGLSSCVKEGPMGLAGTDGTNGKDGRDGESGTASCLVCHNLDVKDAVISEFRISQHASGENKGRSSSNACAPCHSHEGFVEHVRTGLDTTFEGVPNPTTIGCSTCHSTHRTFDFEKDGQDYALRTVKAVDLRLYADNVRVIDFGNSSNLCARCHQPLNSGSLPGDDGKDSYSITSAYFGPHHGPQSTILEGIGLYEVSGSSTVPGTKSHVHRKGSSCVRCHMGTSKNGTGGHTWKASLNSCQTCHPGAASFDVNGSQTKIAGLLRDLKEALIAKGVLDSSGNLNKVNGSNVSAANPMILPVEVAGAYWNYLFVSEDKSRGVHNPPYVEAVLNNTLESLR